MRRDAPAPRQEEGADASRSEVADAITSDGGQAHDRIRGNGLVRLPRRPARPTSSIRSQSAESPRAMSDRAPGSFLIHVQILLGTRTGRRANEELGSRDG
jgi:hypothetical protein